MLLAATAAALAAGGLTAVASIPSANGHVSACVSTGARTSATGLLGPVVTLDRKGTVRAVDADAGAGCLSDELPLSFNVQGPPGIAGAPGPQGAQGSQGLQGPAGAPGASAESLWAVMKGDGSVLRSKGVINDGSGATGRFDVGLYQVQFNRLITNCVAVATASIHGTPFGAILPRLPVVGLSSETQFTVAMFDQNAFLVDSEFTLVVSC